MLQSTLENNAKKLTVQLDIQQLNDTKIEELQALFRSYKGDKALFFNVYDDTKKLKLTLNSKRQKIKITSSLLEDLKEKQCHFKLN